MPRIYHQKESEDSLENPILLQFTKLEILGGAILLALGGFLLRIHRDYSLILVGATLTLLGLVRLWRQHEKKDQDEGIEVDRIFRNLKHRLDANYTIVLNYSLNDHSIPYLIIGPPGIIVIEDWDGRGKVEEREGGDVWELQGSEDHETTQKFQNPIRLNKERIQQLRDRLKENEMDTLPIHNYVVALSRTAEGEPLESDRVVLLNNFIKTIKELPDSSQINWETVDDIEHALNLRERDEEIPL